MKASMPEFLHGRIHYAKDSTSWDHYKLKKCCYSKESFSFKYLTQIFNEFGKYTHTISQLLRYVNGWWVGEEQETSSPSPPLPLRSFLRNFTNSKTIGCLKETMVCTSKCSRGQELAFLVLTSCIEPASETKEDPVVKPPYKKLIVACASSTEDTSTTRGGSGHSSEEASKK